MAKGKVAALMAQPATRDVMQRAARHRVNGRVVSARDEDDLVQTVAVRMLERAAAGGTAPADEAGFHAYVRRAVQNGATDAYRAERRLREQVTEESGVVFAPGLFRDASPEAEVARRHDVSAMRAHLARNYPTGLPLFEAALEDEDAADTCKRLHLTRANYDQIRRRLRLVLRTAGFGR